MRGVSTGPRPAPSLAAVTLADGDLLLEPLRVDHAEEMAPLLDDVRLHAFTGGGPASLEQLRSRYARQVVGRSEDGTQCWLNWVVRADGVATGYVQATVVAGAGGAEAELAWVIGSDHQRRGVATRSAALVRDWLIGEGVVRLAASIAPTHDASAAVARRIRLRPTGTLTDDGEDVWRWPEAGR